MRIISSFCIGFILYIKYGKTWMKYDMIIIRKNGADDGNRTHVTGLGSRRFTIKLHPRLQEISYQFFN